MASSAVSTPTTLPGSIPVGGPSVILPSQQVAFIPRAKTMLNNQPQYPAGFSARATAAVRIPTSQRLTISGCQAAIRKKDQETQKWFKKLAICSYNARSISNDVRLNEIMVEKEKIRCDILGLCETRRKEIKEVKWKDGSYIKLGKGDGPSLTGGIGFVVKKEWSPYISKCKIYSSRVGMLKLNIGKGQTLKIIQVYAPTVVCEEEELEDFYSGVDEALKETTTYTVVMGDFNAKIGKSTLKENNIGKFCRGERNNQGERLATFADTRSLSIANSFYKRKCHQRWTWISPNSEIKNEIDYFLLDKRSIMRNMSVVSSFNTGSDHRMIRLDVNIPERKKRMRKTQAAKPAQGQEGTIVTWSSNSSGDINEDYNTLVDMIKSCSSQNTETAFRIRKDKRMSESTRILLEKRRRMRRNRREELRYKILCQLIRRKLQEDYNNYRCEKLLKAAEDRKSLKRCRRDLALSRSVITSLLDKNGIETQDMESK